ncbi:hypothetical protein F4811DRAFT_549336 [Daldinia bambusicola]|nr:hypothetical protein F4811DRAFT_549336 [Daldinia bambusicola]
MAPPLLILLPLLAWLSLALASSQTLTAYIPECAQPCILASIPQNSNCTGPDDVRCLCASIRPIGSGSVSCAQGACKGNNTEQITNKLHSGFLQFCSDNGAQAGIDSGFPPSWSSSWGGGRPSSSPTASAASAPSTAPADSGQQQQASDSGGGGGGGGSGGLSSGAIAGLAVGVGVACIALTGGLLLYAFRLGRRHSKRLPGDEPADPSPQEGGEGGGGGGGAGGDKGDHPLDGIGIALGSEHKVQLEGAPISELPTEHTLSGFDRVKELATHEKPVELSAEPVARRSEEGSPVLPPSWRL